MSWRTVVISNPAKLRIENFQLVISQAEDISLPLEDIGTLVIESPEVTLSAAALYRLAQSDVHVIVCDERHLPCFSGLPFAGHSRLSGVHRSQLAVSQPFKKRCWQSLIRVKIKNQAECLSIIGNKNAADIRDLAGRVLSGDSGNVESAAARKFFPRAFGQDFIRGKDDTMNAALNYGYAVVRAVVARALTAHGFLLTQGIHHRSELNPFNLADDFIEPFRPVVDLYVATSISPSAEFSIDHRQGLASLLAAEVLIDNKRQSVNHATTIVAGSYRAACESGNASSLLLPDLIPLREHTYE